MNREKIEKLSKNIKNETQKNVQHAKEVAKDFEKFAVKGNVIDLAVGVIIGTAFTKIVNSLVNEIIMPLLSVFTDKMDFTNLFIALDGNTYENIEAAKAAGVSTINYGSFITNIIDFFLVALTIFFVLRYTVNRLRKKHEAQKEVSVVTPTTKKCPFCCSEISVQATKCPFCTSDLKIEENDIN